jgi:hypothetical protein
MKIDKNDLIAGLVTALIIIVTILWSTYVDGKICDYSVHGHYICVDS